MHDEEASGGPNVLQRVLLDEGTKPRKDIADGFSDGQRIVVGAHLPVGYKVLSVEKVMDGKLRSFDIDPTKQCIVAGLSSGDMVDTGITGSVRLWNSRTEVPANETVPYPHCEGNIGVKSFHVSEEEGWDSFVSDFFCDAKFIARKQYFMVGFSSHLHVYNYQGNQIKLVKADKVAQICSLAVHPTQPYVLVAHRDGMIQLLDWEKDWLCKRTFDNEHKDLIMQIKFNPNDINMFATASSDKLVKVWSVFSPISKYTLSGHTNHVNCLDFFERDGHQYMITGSQDCTAKIWNENICVGTMEALVSPIYCVASHPSLPVILTGLGNGTVHLWNSTNFRLERILQIGGTGSVRSFICWKGSTGFIVGQEDAVTVMEIDNVKEEPQLSTRKGRAMIKEVVRILAGSRNQLDARPQELLFPLQPNKSSRCILKLSNITGDDVVWRLVEGSNESSEFFPSLPEYGVLQARDTCYLVVETRQQKERPEQTEFDLILQSAILADEQHAAAMKQQSTGAMLFDQLEMTERNAPQEIQLKAVITWQGETASAVGWTTCLAGWFNGCFGCLSELFV